MKKKQSFHATLLCAALLTVITLSPTSRVHAEDSIDQLEKQTNELQNSLSSLNNEFTSLSEEIVSLTSQIDELNTNIEKTELDLAAARLSESSQYDSMKKRIKFMYEESSTSLMDVLLTADSMADFLNAAEFIKNVSEYDRSMLDELKEVAKTIEEKEASLKSDQEQLSLKKAELDTRSQELNEKIAATSEQLQVSQEALAAAKEAQRLAEEAKAREQAKAMAEAENQQASANSSQTGSSNTQSTGGGSSTTVNNPVSASTNDLVLFAAILQCEAGSSSYDALLAVATVVMNRVESPRYPNTLSGVIYQKGQFSPTWNGSLNKVLGKGPASLCYTVAQDALAGKRLSAVSGCYQFRASYTGHAGTVIGGNVFF